MLSRLNNKQKEAVLATAGPVLIIAGAGSGKTQVLTHRIAYLLSQKTAYPSQIFAVTFTNKAAKEMKARVLKLLSGIIPEKEINAMWVNTFHAACVRILRTESENVGLPKNFVIYDTSDQLSIIKKILKELDIDDKQFKPNSILSSISSAKNELVAPENYVSAAYDVFSKKVGLIYPAYQSVLRQQNALDFDDILYYTVELFKKRPDILRNYQERFKYVLVDEYQDTNVCQYSIVHMLAAKHNNICAVGDGDQNIYSWRGANSKNILNFEKDFPAAKTIMLEQNYRSTPNILKAANDVIKNNSERKDKNLWTENPENEQVVHYRGINEREEAAYVAEQIELLMNENNYSLKDFVILYRTNAQSRVIEDVFMYKNIKYQIIGAFKFYERKEIKDILAYLRLIYNMNDNYSLLRALASTNRGIGNTSIAKLEQFAKERQTLMFEALNVTDVLKGKAALAAKDFYKIIKELQSALASQTYSLSEFIELVVEKTGYLDALSAQEDKEYQDRTENIMELVSVAREHDGATLEDFLMSVSLVSDIDEADSDKDVVTLMTLHSAKGLEFPVVFMVGMEEGLLPHFRSLFELDEIEEERRLCYVGMTRAKSLLFMSSVITRTIFGNTASNEISRFIKEISKENLKEENSPKLATNDKKYNFIAASGISFSPKRDSEKYKEKDNMAEGGYSVGDQVLHPTFGRGCVTYLYGSGINTTLTIRFTDEERTLMLKYAPIEKV
ncbi:MAG: ATP-dependent DNA helicase PcrA [Candidatus Margulisiibacteriota bacterium]|nr:MAG: ATP-dependent DNA helicase PcrA [Candidatus Margulisiibacteriota bacterium]HCY37540.1 ATP-dependent DNA helicase PcrA [Candidatus Margulisiibacteriota bacterium]